MPYGLLTPDMEALVAEHVSGSVVWDLGAGDLIYALRLLELGAGHVVAIDKDLVQINTPAGAGLTLRRDYFADIEPVGEIEVAFLSWPRNGAIWGLEDLLAKARKVIYLGCNTGGSACADEHLFRSQLCPRELLGHIPHPRNSLLVYGEQGKRTGPLTGEEFAVLSRTLMAFEEAQEAARQATEHWR